MKALFIVGAALAAASVVLGVSLKRWQRDAMSVRDNYLYP